MGSIGSSGGEIASCFVSIGGDLTGLREAEAEARRITERIGQMMTGGAGQIGNPINGAGSIGGMALTVKIDEQGIKTQLESAFRSFTMTMQPIQVPVEFVPQGGGMGGAAAGAGASPTESMLHRGGFGSGATGMRSRNPLSIYGASSRLGIPLLAAFGAESVASFGAGIGEAIDIESHPERILRQYDQVGSPMDVMNDPIMQSLSAAKAGVLAERRSMAATQSLPLIGGFIALGNSLSGASGRLDDRDFAITREIEGHQYEYQLGHSEAVRAARLEGNLGHIAEAELAGNEDYLRRKAAPLASLKAKAAAITAAFARSPSLSFNAGEGSMASYESRNPYTVYERDETNRQLAEAQAAQDELTNKVHKNNRIELNRAYSQQGVNESRLVVSNYAANLRNAALTQLGDHVPGSQLSSLDLIHKADMAMFDIDTMDAVTKAPDAKKGDVSNDRLAKRAEAEKKYAKDREAIIQENESRVTSIQAQGDAARLRSRHDAFQADLTQLKQHADEVRRAIKDAGLPAADQAAINAAMQEPINAATYAHNEEIRNAFGDAGVSFGNSMLAIQAASMRAQGRGREAELLSFGAERNRLQEQLRQGISRMNLGNIGETLPQIIGFTGQIGANEANAATALYLNQRQHALTAYAAQQRGAAADANAIGNSTEASAINEVTRAQLELANADPEDRGVLRKALVKELHATQARLTGAAGHATAISSSIDQAVAWGVGIDWGGRANDREGAISALSHGINDINSGKVVAQGADMKKTNDLLGKILNAILTAIGQNAGSNMVN